MLTGIAGVDDINDLVKTDDGSFNETYTMSYAGVVVLVGMYGQISPDDFIFN